MGSYLSTVPKDPTNTLALEVVKKKAGEALSYVNKAHGPTGPPKGEGIRAQGDHKEIVDIWWLKERAQLVLAFNVPPEVLQSTADKAEQPKCLSDLRKLKLKEGTVTVAPEITHVLDHFLDKKAKQKVEAILGKRLPRTIVCAGASVGGSLAGVASVLLAVRYPSAEVRCITVDAPIITYGNAAYATLYQHLVGFSYHLNTAELLYLYPPEQGGRVLYGQWAKDANLKPQPFDPTKANLRGWKEEEWKKLVSTAAPIDGSKLTPSAEAMPDPVEAARTEKENVKKVKMACQEADVVSPDVEKWLKEMFSKDPSKELSLRWTDEAKTFPFQKLDTIEKMLLSGKRVAAMAGLASAAYCDKEGFCSKTGLQDAIFINRDGPGQADGQGYVVYRPEINTLLVAFRGTAGMTDTLTDVNFSHKQANFLETIVEGASVHVRIRYLPRLRAAGDVCDKRPLVLRKSFYTQLVDMFSDLSNAIANLTLDKSTQGGDPVQHIYVTGHSLGGALATIGAAMLAKKFPTADVNSITFAAPRAGNAQFEAAFATLVSTSLRFVYNYDAVPTVPMWYLGFKHVDNCLWIKPADPAKAEAGMDHDVEIELNAVPPHSPSQCLYEVGDDLIANHTMNVPIWPKRHTVYWREAFEATASTMYRLAFVEASHEAVCLPKHYILGMGGRYIGSLVGRMYRLAEEEKGVRPAKDTPVPSA